jgi:two-component system, LytTR family, response regulator
MKAVIIDDELSNILLLKKDLLEYCSEVVLVKEFTSPTLALAFLKNNPVDIVFLDISMPEMNGFDFLGHFENPKFSVIFVTAFENFALQAFEFYAVDYLLKPVSSEKLRRAVNRVIEKKSGENTEIQQLNMMIRGLQQVYQKSNTLSIPTLQGLEMIELSEIKYLMAEGNYVELIMKTNMLVVSKSLGDFEKVLDPQKFVRIHNSYIVNVNEIKKYIRGDGGIVELLGGIQLPVSRINKPKLLQLIKADF